MPLSRIGHLLAHVKHDVRSYSAQELERISSRQSLRTAVSHGDLIKAFAGIYISAEHQDSFAARAHAALRWAGPRASLGGSAALFLWGGLERAPSQIQVIVPHGTGLRPPPWVRLTRAGYPFRTASWQSLALVTADFALIQAYGLMPVRDRDGAVYQCVQRGLLDPQLLSEALDTTPRVRLRSKLRATINAALLGSESVLEQQGADVAFACAELSGLLRQHRVRVAQERYRCDFYDAATRTAIELDGAAYHGNLEARERDIRRDVRLASIGIQTVRFGYRDIMDRPQWCREQLITILHQRGSGASRSR